MLCEDQLPESVNRLCREPLRIFRDLLQTPEQCLPSPTSGPCREAGFCPSGSSVDLLSASPTCTRSPGGFRREALPRPSSQPALSS